MTGTGPSVQEWEEAHPSEAVDARQAVAILIVKECVREGLPPVKNQESTCRAAVRALQQNTLSWTKKMRTWSPSLTIAFGVWTLQKKHSIFNKSTKTMARLTSNEKTVVLMRRKTKASLKYINRRAKKTFRLELSDPQKTRPIVFVLKWKNGAAHARCSLHGFFMQRNGFGT